MKKYFRHVVCVFSFLLCMLHQPAEAQRRTCKLDVGMKVKYDLVYSYRSSLAPYILSLRVVVSPDKFNRLGMLQLARTIQAQFCNDDEISAVIFDDKTAAKKADIEEFATGKKLVPELRGFYVLSKRDSSEFIQFSTSRGNPNNEVILQVDSADCRHFE